MADETNQTSDGASEPEATQVLEDLEQLRAKAEERDKFLDMLQRTKADFDNYQKRMHRDLEQERRYQLWPLAKDLLPALDNLERALGAAKEDSPLTRGVALVRTQLLETLKRHGIKRIEATGRPFDPNLHEAVMQQPSNQPPGTVLQVLEQGYQYHDRVLRPAKVVLAANAQ
jgi:molecular chaperone GrpE